jgi:hypothetical protein
MSAEGVDCREDVRRVDGRTVREEKKQISV